MSTRGFGHNAHGNHDSTIIIFFTKFDIEELLNKNETIPAFSHV